MGTWALKATVEVIRAVPYPTRTGRHRTEQQAMLLTSTSCQKQPLSARTQQQTNRLDKFRAAVFTITTSSSMRPLEILQKSCPKNRPTPSRNTQVDTTTQSDKILEWRDTNQPRNPKFRHLLRTVLESLKSAAQPMRKRLHASQAISLNTESATVRRRDAETTQHQNQ